jgi:prephenate dehydrogenase
LRVAVLGVGLIGGSIGLAAHARAAAQVVGWDPDPQVRERALAFDAITEQATSVESAVAGAQVAFVAAPVSSIVETARTALAHADEDCVVTDVGSTKRLVADSLSDPRFVGGHPLAGAETAGVEHARADLFDGATWYLAPAPGTTGVLYERLHGLLRRLGATPTAIEPAAHDRLMAVVSHMPHVLANLLVSQAAALVDGEQRERLPAVGPSFRDATRVAGANSAIWTDIYMSNRDAIVEGLDELAARLGGLRATLAAGEREPLTAWNERARTDRDALLGAGIAGGPVHELRVSVPNRPGVIADIALALGRAGVNIVDMALSPSQDNRQGVVALWIAGKPDAERAQGLISKLGLPVVAA